MSFEPSEDTVRRLADLQESEEEEDGGGTAKQKDSAKTPTAATATAGPGSPGFTAPLDWRNSIAQNRLSSLFDSWIHSGSPSASTTELPHEKKTVSEPKLIAHATGGTIGKAAGTEAKSDAQDGEDVDAQDFEEMLVSSASGLLLMSPLMYILGFYWPQRPQARRYVQATPTTEAVSLQTTSRV